LQGATIQEFMPLEDDRRKFVEQVSGVDKASWHAEAFHAKISDCNATHISMEFFSVAFSGPDSRRRHLLGMREFTDIQPLTPTPRLRPPAPAASSPQAPPPERAARLSWPGTPANNELSERGDILQHSAGSETSSLAAPPPAQGQRRETGEVARRLSLLTTMMSWHVGRPEGACCRLHALVAQARGAVGEIAAWPCNPAFRQNEEWQCERCGIVADEYRPSSRQRRPGCLLCREAPMDPERAEGGGRRVFTAL